MKLKTQSVWALAGCLFVATLSISATAQSQASNGCIEGIVTDQMGTRVIGARVTVTNRETGVSRSVSSDEEGTFRFPLLPLGIYRVSAAADSFKTTVRDGITLSTGQTVIANLSLQVGDIREIVTISSDAPIADAGRIEVGRVMNNKEVQNLPLISLNPYNFVFLQSNVTGNRTAAPDVGFPNVNANGFSRRGSYMIDGNYATDVTLGGVRMLLLSRTYVNEVQLTTRGMPAEFGWTVGHVTNFVTQSGGNAFRGNSSYQFRRPGFAAELFNVAPGSRQPVADVFTAGVGGPIRRRRWHYYFGLEALKWDLARAARVITISEVNKPDLILAGVPASAMPSTYGAKDSYLYAIGRTDAQVNSSNRLSLRFLITKVKTEKNGASGLNTLQLSRDNAIFEHSLGAQLISNKGDRFFNELRFQHSMRRSFSEPNEHTGTGDITIRIQGVANFGAPLDGHANFEYRPLTTIQNNTSKIFGSHSVKTGGGLAFHRAFQPSTPSAIYTFANIQRYRDALTGFNRRSYANYSDTIGDASTRTEAIFLNAFVQDDWRVGRRLRLNVGIRYDLFLLPNADPTAGYLPSRKFNVDKNNIGPRLGVVYSVSDGKRPAVIRASAGLYYDPPIMDYYRRALLRDGSPQTFSLSLNSQSGPEFPGRYTSLPTGQPTQVQVIEALSADFKTMTALHSNIQFEKAIAENFSVQAGYSFSRGWHIPTSRNVNCIPTGRTLADGRPTYGNTMIDSLGNVTIQPCTNRNLPQFSGIWVWESAGTLTYNAMALALVRRLSSDFQFTLNYTLSHSVDDAPEENIATVAQWQSDASDRSRDRATSLSNQRHTFVATFVGTPRLKLRARIVNYIANGNQFSIIARASDGERYNILATADLNGDGRLMDRPVGIPRNALKTSNFFNLDLRYSRRLRLGDRYELELFTDIVNFTNTNTVIGFTNTTLSTGYGESFVDPFTGELRRPLPDFKSRGIISTDSRRVQLGIKIYF